MSSVDQAGGGSSDSDQVGSESTLQAAGAGAPTTAGPTKLLSPHARKRSQTSESQLGLRSRVTLAFTLGALVLSIILGAATLNLTRRSLLAERERRTITRTSVSATTLDGLLKNL